MSIPELIPQESARFAAWSYDAAKCWLYVRFKPTKKADGKLYYYTNVAPEQWEDAQEAKSKGSWLIAEIINRKDRHPYFQVDESFGAVPTGASPAAASTPAESHERIKTEPATMTDMKLVPEAVREVQPVPSVALKALPEILPPDVAEGDKPFTQIMRERALAISAAVPMAVAIADEDSYRANGAALVVIQTERRALEDALEILARPLIDSKRRLDDFRNTVLGAYKGSEARLETALHNFRRAAEARAKADAQRIREENEARAAQVEVDRRKAEAARVAEAAAQRKEEAERIIAEAEAEKTARPANNDAQGSLLGEHGADTVIEEAQQIIAEAEAEVVAAQAHAAAPIERSEIYTPPVAVAAPDLKVSGMRRRAAKWVWEVIESALKKAIDQTGPISRAHMKDPNSIPDEFWILDKKAIDGLVDGMHDRIDVNLPSIRAYDKNA